MTRLAYRRAKTAGVAMRPLLKGVGLTRAQVEDPTVRIRVHDQIAFLNSVADTLADDLLGYHLAQFDDLRQIGAFYYVLASSETLREVLQRGARYSSIVNEGIVQTCIDGRHIGMGVEYSGISRHLDRHQIEFWLTVLLRVFRHLTGVHMVPVRVRLTHVRSSNHRELTEFFGRAPEFGARADDITFARNVGSLPVVNADPHLSKVLVDYCEAALAHRRRAQRSFRSSVENIIVPLLPHGSALASEVAGRLGMSQRTFARRLADEGLTFSELLHGLRLDLANRYLADSKLSISEIAWLLGYQEVSAFSNAYKRWTGISPSDSASRAGAPSD